MKAQTIKIDRTTALPEMLSPYVARLIHETGGPTGPIGRQFLLQKPVPKKIDHEYDIQEEHRYEVAPGLIYKYKGKINTDGTIKYHGRVLWTISRYCATYCRFCFRGRMVGMPGTDSNNTGETLGEKAYLSDDDVQNVISFIKSHPEINEVILSGGDPLVGPKSYLSHIIEELVRLQKNKNIDIIRIHTRAPITNPKLLQDWHLKAFATVKNPYIVLHINHPAEITKEVVTLIDKIRQTGAIILSQSVLLKGVNDEEETLLALFNKLVTVGVLPYYLHQCDPVDWAADYVVAPKKAIKLWQSLRPKLSGLAAAAKFVIDTPHGSGKIIIPDGSFETDYSEYKDFQGKKRLF